MIYSPIISLEPLTNLPNNNKSIKQCSKMTMGRTNNITYHTKTVEKNLKCHVLNGHSTFWNDYRVVTLSKSHLYRIHYAKFEISNTIYKIIVKLRLLKLTFNLKGSGTKCLKYQPFDVIKMRETR